MQSLDKALDIRSRGHRRADRLLPFAQSAGRVLTRRSSIRSSRGDGDLHEAVAAAPEDATANNNYAWLVGNTEGDFDEAIRCSRKSVELQPDEGGYYDTLAHVYFGKGDLKNAVKYEAKAAKLDPHSGLVRIALEQFRKNWRREKN